VKPLGAGKYNKKITIQQRLVSVDDYGQWIANPTWATYRADVWAELQIGQGREYYGAKRTIPELSGLITIRYLQGVKSSMRVLFGTRIFDILSIVPKGKNLREEIEMRVKEVFA
jgi:SPP1 family predicted phage head-tail adaptor